MWGKSLLGLTPDGRRLYVSSQGVVPGTLDAYAQGFSDGWFTAQLDEEEDQ